MDQINNVFSNQDVPIYFLYVNNPQNSEYKHYIEIEWDRSMCRSPIGRQKNIGGNNPNKNVIKLSNFCVMRKTLVEHEIMHSLGFWHEHQRPDRDEYIDLDMASIDPNHQSDFTKFQKDKWENTDQEYDIGSIMHYSRMTFRRGSELTYKIKQNANLRSKITSNLGIIDNEIDQKVNYVAKEAYHQGFSNKGQGFQFY